MEKTLSKKTVKLGIVLNSFVVPKWIEKVINDIKILDFVEIKTVIVNNNSSVSNFQRNKRKHFLYNKYCEVDYKYYSNKVKLNAFKKININDLLFASGKNINIVEVFTNYFTKADIESLQNEELDLIIQLGFGEILSELSNIAKHGLWYFSHDNSYNIDPQIFKAMLNQNDPIEVSLVNLLNNETKVIFQSEASVMKESLFFNCNAIYWKSSQIIIRKLTDLHEGKAQCENEILEKNTNKIIHSNPQLPSNLETVSLLKKLVISKMKSKLFHEQWFLAFKNINKKNENYTIIRPPSDRFYADPFIFKKDNKTFIFFEEYIYSKGKGDISVMELDPDNNKCSEPICILDKPFHLSYPFIFEWEENIYLIPETSENRTIELYKAKEFPYKWELEKVLIDEINAVDATIIHHNNKFWMFTNVFEDGASSLDELHIFYSDELLGNWVPHKMNPVITTAASARPAGKIFKKDGKLIRPSQDCSFSYGYAVKFNEILMLTEEKYRERLITELKPNWLKNNKGTHSYNFNEDFEVIDGRSMIRKRL